MEQLDIHSNFHAYEDYLERSEIWTMTKKDVENINIMTHFLKFIGEAYSLLKSLVYPDKPTSLPYTTLRKLLLNHVKFSNFECRK